MKKSVLITLVFCLIALFILAWVQSKYKREANELALLDNFIGSRQSLVAKNFHVEEPEGKSDYNYQNNFYRFRIQAEKSLEKKFDFETFEQNGFSIYFNSALSPKNSMTEMQEVHGTENYHEYILEVLEIDLEKAKKMDLSNEFELKKVVRRGRGMFALVSEAWQFRTKKTKGLFLKCSTSKIDLVCFFDYENTKFIVISFENEKNEISDEEYNRWLASFIGSFEFIDE